VAPNESWRNSKVSPTEKHGVYSLGHPFKLNSGFVILAMRTRQPTRQNIGCNHADDPSVSRSALRVLIVAVPPMRTLDVFGPAEVFGDANWLRGGDPAYKVTIISACADRVVSNHLGTPVHTDRTYREYRGPIDTLLVAGCMGPRELHYEPGFLNWLRVQSTRARRFGSICTGAFVLAKAGLLDGRRATTHWNWASELAQDHPRVTVDPDPIYIRDGSCYTSAGVTAGIDLCLALVEQDLGRPLALRIAQMMVVFLPVPVDSRNSAPPSKHKSARADRWVICLLGFLTIFDTTSRSAHSLAARP
jgi:transcriptional regulator GlxA family with amidase domain